MEITSKSYLSPLSTPTTDGSFSVYDDLKKKLMDAGIPEEEIAFIHTADSEAKKKELFSKVRAGQVRVLLGSTAKMGAGTNVQDRLIALHDLDCPGGPLICSSGWGASSARAMKMRRWKSIAMSPRAPLTLTSTSLWRTSRSLSGRS